MADREERSNAELVEETERLLDSIKDTPDPDPDPDSDRPGVLGVLLGRFRRLR